VFTVERTVDAQDTIDGAILEVLSGINCPLMKPAHFARRSASESRSHLDLMMAGSFLNSCQAEDSDLTQEGKRYQIPFSMIEKSNYEHDWSA
jgi:ribosome maturation factor RimP